MPVRRRGPLLAGVGLLLGLYAGTGCQHVPARADGQADPPVTEGSKSFSFFRHSDANAKTPKTAANKKPRAGKAIDEQAAQDRAPAASILRPVALPPEPEDPTLPSTPDLGPPLGLGNPPGDSGIVQTSGVADADAPLMTTSGWGDPDKNAERQPAGLAPMLGPGGGDPTPFQVPATPAGLPDSWADDPNRQPAGNAPEQPAAAPAEDQAPGKAQPIPAQVPGAKKVTPAVLLLPPKPMHHPPYPGCPVPKEFAKRSLSAYVIEPPDILLVEGTPAIGLRTQPLAGPHLVRPDGTVGLGIYGSRVRRRPDHRQAKAGHRRRDQASGPPRT